MNIIGLSAMYHDAAAALCADGEIITAVQEERFTRKKHDPAFPIHALEHCIGQIHSGGALHAIVLYENPVLSLDRVLKNALHVAPQGGGIWEQSMRSMLGSKIELGERAREYVDSDDKVLVGEHHLSHAASAFYPAPFDEAAILVVDGVGEWATTTIAAGNGNDITPLAELRYPNSLGLLYSAFTEYCGLRVNSGEYKLMGLAPYGLPRFAGLIRDELIDIKPDGSFRLNTDYFGFLDRRRATGEKFHQLFGGPALAPDADLSLKHMDIAASIQAVVNDVVEKLARTALARTGSKNLCMAGGVALNCVANGRLHATIPDLEGLWIQPASGDAGGALGAALHTAHSHFNIPRRTQKPDAQRGSLIGSSFGAPRICSDLKKAGLVYQSVEDDDERNRTLAKALADGAIVGRFEGAMEFGPRALGNRSILADPRRADAQQRINLKIKFRESWRPFAVAVLAEQASNFFDLKDESPYMLIVAKIKEAHRKPVNWDEFRIMGGNMLEFVNQERSDYPGITHVDYSARIQTVEEARNASFTSLIRAFEAETGCPMLINTSFNVRGEPLVCTPDDAIACFLNTGLDVLAIGDCLVWKNQQSQDIIDMEGKTAYELD
ncbi:carbamoyltransferase N-terminal domain-containing protein [Pseudophaeobacter sp.]|uniref:carbamoyltransferase family protein n=1 Tax=Pseudophaeobacter sp. TaxID=1971739 RepID=UPI003296BB80